MKRFNHKNNHVFKLKEFNQLMFLTISLNNQLWNIYLFIKYQQNERKEGNHKYLQHPNNHPNNEGWMHNQVDKTPHLFDMLMK
jgi:isoprenylcysteine carboxyl methyltransferase (ICMT) family protein YpbQ